MDNKKRIKIYQDLFKETNMHNPINIIYKKKDIYIVSSRIAGLEPTTYQGFTFKLFKATIK